MTVVLYQVFWGCNTALESLKFGISGESSRLDELAERKQTFAAVQSAISSSNQNCQGKAN